VVAPFAEIERTRNVAAHFNGRSDTGTLWQSANVAAQQGLGILPERGHQFSASRPADTVSNGPIVESRRH